MRTILYYSIVVLLFACSKNEQPIVDLSPPTFNVIDFKLDSFVAANNDILDWESESHPRNGGSKPFLTFIIGGKTNKFYEAEEMWHNIYRSLRDTVFFDRDEMYRVRTRFVGLAVVYNNDSHYNGWLYQ
jgi:hypothetical protein